MSKIRIAGLRKDLEQVTALLHSAGVLHIDRPSPEVLSHLNQISPGEDLAQEIERLDRELSRIRSLMSHLSLPFLPPLEKEVSPVQVRFIVDELFPQVRERLARRESLQQELLLLNKYEAILLAFSPFLSYLGDSPYLEYLGFTLAVAEESLLQRLGEELSKVTGGQHEMVTRRAAPETFVVLLIYPRTCDPEIRKILWEAGLADIRLPAAYSDRSFVEALKGVLERKSRIPEDLGEIDRCLRSTSETHGHLLADVGQQLQDRLIALKTSISFHGTPHTFLIYGWVPQSDLPSLRSRLSSIPDVWVEGIPFSSEEWARVPVYLKHFQCWKVFERLTALLPAPQYGGTDPTPWFAFFFPTFFGMMVGDAVYGALFLGLAWWVRRRWKRQALIRDLATIFALASGTAMVFGFLFGEYFGFPAERLGLPGGWIHREDSLILLMVLSIGIGWGHLMLGLFLRLFSSLRRRERTDLWITVGKMLFLGGSALVFLQVLGRLSLLPAALGWMAVALALTVLIVQERWRAPFEVIKVMTHVLSYVRLMGFGIAAVYLAYLANHLGETLRPWFWGFAAALFFHGLNLVMGLYAPAVQSLRLLYVEFCEKFYLSGGIPYQPFSKRTKEVKLWS